MKHLSFMDLIIMFVNVSGIWIKEDGFQIMFKNSLDLYLHLLDL